MKGVSGFIGIAIVIYVFWVTIEYFSDKRRKNKNVNKKTKKNEKSK